MNHVHKEDKLCPDHECLFHDAGFRDRYFSAKNTTDVTRMCKIHVSFDDGGGESLWAMKIEGTDYVVVLNSPFMTRAFSLHDIVEVDSRKEFKRLVMAMTKTVAISYDANVSYALIKKRHKKLSGVVKKHGMFYEGACAGIASVSMPASNTIDDLKKILAEEIDFGVDIIEG